ncbi:MAG: helix-turn-helix domain-containing protein [Spirochaetes bacterium]|nr:helix-turn-helix domain-containing protein [Spirochaetota bacterium]
MRKSSKSANYRSLKGELEEYSTEKLHSHKDHQFLVISSGISMLEEKISKKVQFGRMCAFIPAGVMHRTTVVGKRISYQSIYIDSFRMKVKENKAVMFSMSSISRALVDELTLPSKHHSVIIPACFELFLKTAERDMENESSIMTLIIPKRRENMLLADYIEKHFRERISMKELKSVIPYTERHINRIFSDETGITPVDYVRMTRIYHASMSLITGNKSVVQTAFDCGYENLSVFYSDFSRFYSKSPKQFIKEMSQS